MGKKEGCEENKQSNNNGNYLHETDWEPAKGWVGIKGITWKIKIYNKHLRLSCNLTDKVNLGKWS